MNKVKAKVLCTDKQTGKTEIVSFDYAIEKLIYSWSDEAIEGMLFFGSILSDSYSTYEVVEIEK